MAANQQSTIPHLFNNKVISQTKEDTKIGLNLIPKGYCNATEMCKANNKKRWNDYKRLKSTQEYWKALERSTGILVDLLVIENESSGPNDERGTWVHPDIAMDLAQWISVEFRIWANRTLRAVLNNEYEALTENAQKAKEKLDAEYEYIWQKARDVGKIARRSLTDSIKEYLLRHPELSESDKTWMYSNVSDCLNIAIFGMKADPLCQKRGCAKNKLRDTHSEQELNAIEHHERYAMRMIDKFDCEPLRAMREAIEFYS